MSYSVSGTMITLTRGDTFSALITITDLNDNQYIPMNGDRIRFAMKNDYYRSKISRNYWLFEPKCRNNAEITYTQRLQIASYFP